jgi:hypothetical protein
VVVVHGKRTDAPKILLQQNMQKREKERGFFGAI